MTSTETSQLALASARVAHVVCWMVAVVCGATGVIGLAFGPSLSVALLLAAAGGAASSSSLISTWIRRDER